MNHVCGQAAPTSAVAQVVEVNGKLRQAVQLSAHMWRVFSENHAGQSYVMEKTLGGQWVLRATLCA